MFLRLYKFLRGYVVLEVMGFAVARFVNLAAYKNIYIWNMRQIDGRVFFNVSVKGFFLLKQPMKKSGCRVKIIRKVGLPVMIRKYRGRIPYIAGLLMFAGLIFFLTSFLWLVNVTGNDSIETEAIRGKLRQLGVHPGLPKRGLEPREIEEELINAFPGIAYTNLIIRGTRADLSVIETIKAPEPIDRSVPSDIIARADGIIREMATEAGRPLARVGDVVAAGDMLVSGELRVGADDTGYTTYLTHAISRVMAKRFYEYAFDLPLSYEIKSFTGNVEMNYGIMLFEQRVALKNRPSPFLHYDVRTDERRLSFGRDYPLPAVLFTETFREFVPVSATRSQDEAEIMARTIVDARLLRELPENYEVLDTNIVFEAVDDVLRVHAVITVLEEIGETRIREAIQEEIQQEVNTTNE